MTKGKTMKMSQKEIGKTLGEQPNVPLLRIFLILAFSVLVFATNPASRASELPNVFDDYSIKVLEPPPDTTEIWFVFINEKGNVVMQYFTEPPSGEAQGHTAILENGEWKVIDVPDSFWCGVSNPNASGRMGVVYVSTPEDDANGIWHNAIYDRGSYIPLPDHPDWQYGIQEINDHGLMTGLAFVPDGEYRYHGLLLNASLSLFKVFDVPGADRTIAFGINNAGWIVGPYRKAADGMKHGFLSYLGESFEYIDFPGAENTWPFAINNKGEIAGMYADADGVLKGFLLRDGKFARFVIPNTQFNTIDWLVDNGSLSGNYVDLDGKPHGYIAKRVSGRK
jgi:hypothetical protein